MKNKKLSIVVYSYLLMAGTLLFTDCTKNKTNEAPSPDYEFETTKDMSRLQMIISDIGEMAAEAGDGASGILPHHSYPAPGLSIMQGTVQVNNTPAVLFVDPVTKYYTLTFANTIGKDGHVRNGTLTYNYYPSTYTDTEFPAAPPSVDYYRQPGFRCDVTSSGYSVDNNTVTITKFRITNTTPVGFPSISPYTPANYNLTWREEVDVTVATGAVVNSVNGTIYKTLLNTNNTSVPMPGGISPQTFTIYPGPGYATLNWAKAYMSYSGSGVANLQNIGATNYTITNVTRNNNSSPEAFYMDGAGMFVSPERHPFLSGMMTFKPGAKATRDVNYGFGEVVDYNAKVTIEGITYEVDCRE
jgi:hypothetical protein